VSRSVTPWAAAAARIRSASLDRGSSVEAGIEGTSRSIDHAPGRGEGLDFDEEIAR
jgi:hypothetical protein